MRSDEELLNRIISLENAVKKLSHINSDKKKSEIPSGYMSITNFCHEFKFCSSNAIGTWIKDNPEFFSGNWVKKQQVFINPKHVIKFVLFNFKRNPCYKQLMNWCEFIPSLKTIVENVLNENLENSREASGTNAKLICLSSGT